MSIKLTYCTDTRPVQAIVDNAKNSDLFICEGMYGEKDKESKAKEYKHMTFYEAAELAKNADVKEMWLTHYSPSLIRPADGFVIETLSYILHGDRTRYKSLFKIKTKKTAEENGFKGIPYFLKCGDHYISQYNMSSGESMLISLIDFINNLTERNKYVSAKAPCW